MRRAIALVSPLREQLAQTLTHVNTEAVPRRTFNPRALAALRGAVEGRRILLIEDSWVTGATAVSAAGSLLAADAASVLILPVARVIDTGFWPEDHPYRTALREPWDPFDSNAWPR